MKILYHHRTRSRDGQSVHIDEMIKALEKEGVDVQMVGPRRVDALQPSRHKQVLPRIIYEMLELGYSGLELIKLIRAIWRQRPDAIYERANIYTLSGLWASRLFSLPLLLEVNAPLADERGQFGGLAMPAVARWSEEAVWRGATIVMPVTEVLAKIIARAGVARSRIVVTSNGVDIARFSEVAPLDRSRLPPNFKSGLILGFVGYVRAWHGLPQVVDLLAHDSALADANLLIVGDGPGTADLLERARALGVEGRVHIAGLVERDALAAYIRTFDVALQPEVTSYASPLKLFEYMALSRAIVAPDAPNIREILTDNVDAILFEPNNPASFAQAVRAVALDPALRLRLGKCAGDAIINKDMSWSRNARRAIGLIKEARKS